MTEKAITLYDIAEAYKLLDLFLASDVEDRGEWQLALDNIADQFTTKAQNIARLVRNYQATEAAYQTEAERLEKVARSYANRSKWLLDYLRGNMVTAGLDKVDGVPSVRLQKNSVPTVEITIPAELFDTRYTRVVTTIAYDKEKIVREWRAGEWTHIDGVNITVGYHVRIG